MLASPWFVFRVRSGLCLGFPVFFDAQSQAVAGTNGGQVVILTRDKFNRIVSSQFAGSTFVYYLRFIPATLPRTTINELVTFPGSLLTDNSSLPAHVTVDEWA